MTEILDREVSAETVEALEAGRATNSSILVPIALATSVNPDWLSFGEGAMRRDGDPSVLDGISEALSDDELHVLRLWRLQPLEVRPHLVGLMEQNAKTMDPSYVAYEGGVRTAGER